jgi:hypothetical protein
MGKTYTYQLMDGNTVLAEYNCMIHVDRYVNNRLALMLYNDEDGPIADITKNVPQQPLMPGEIIVKAYSENVGMDTWLIENNIATYTGKSVSSGYVTMPIMMLTLEFFLEHNIIP